MAQNSVRSGRGTTTTESLEVSRGIRCGICSEWTKVATINANGKYLCEKCSGNALKGIVIVEGEE